MAPESSHFLLYPPQPVLESGKFLGPSSPVQPYWEQQATILGGQRVLAVAASFPEGCVGFVRWNYSK